MTWIHHTPSSLGCAPAAPRHGARAARGPELSAQAVSVAAFLPVHPRAWRPSFRREDGCASKQAPGSGHACPVGKRSSVLRGGLSAHRQVDRIYSWSWRGSAQKLQFCSRGTILEETLEILDQSTVPQAGELTSYQACWGQRVDWFRQVSQVLEQIFLNSSELPLRSGDFQILCARHLGAEPPGAVSCHILFLGTPCAGIAPRHYISSHLDFLSRLGEGKAYL